jgi:hypothetical protein
MVARYATERLHKGPAKIGSATGRLHMTVAVTDRIQAMLLLPGGSMSGTFGAGPFAPV